MEGVVASAPAVAFGKPLRHVMACCFCTVVYLVTVKGVGGISGGVVVVVVVLA